MSLRLVFAAACASLALVGCGSESEPGQTGQPNTCEGGVEAGARLDVPDATWSWVPIEGSVCRDGTPTGIGVFERPGATRLMIYLEGGGACFNGLSCQLNSGHFDAESFAQVSFTGLLDTTNAANPFADASIVYVPYCTGDVHAGSAENVDVPGPGGPDGQMFVGHDNVRRALARIAPTFPGMEEVVLAGVSAGGFGTWLNYDQVARTFCEEPVTLLDDSGPALTDDYLTPCLQSRWRQLWNLAETLPEGCTDCTGADGGGISNVVPFLADQYADARFGLISSTRDQTISMFFSFGANDCEALSAGNPPLAAGAALFEAGLPVLREQVLAPLPNVSSYVVDSAQHTWTRDEGFFTTSAGGVELTAWTEALVTGPTPPPAGP